MLYDADCSMCVGLAHRLSGVLRRARFDLAPLQTPWVRRRLGLGDASPIREMAVLSSAGTVVGGADAVVLVARRIWWAWPLWVFAMLPGAAARARSNCPHRSPIGARPAP